MSNRVFRLAGILKWASLFAGTIYLAATVAALLAGSGWRNQFISATVDADGLPAGWAAATALLLAAITFAAMIQLAQMLGRIGKDRVFSPGMIRRFRNFCLLFLMMLLVRSVLPAIMALVAAMWSGAGGVRLTFDVGEIITLVIAALLFLVAHLLEQASRWEDDSRSIV